MLTQKKPSAALTLFLRQSGYIGRPM